jgi:hypothetical protein
MPAFEKICTADSVQKPALSVYQNFPHRMNSHYGPLEMKAEDIAYLIFCNCALDEFVNGDISVIKCHLYTST